MAYSTVESLDVVQPRHRPPVRVRGTMRSKRHAQGAALSRHSLANPHILENVSKFCPQDPRRVWRARVPTTAADAALLVPQGGARDMLLAPDPRRCAAVAARVGRCLRAAERVSLRASQDRCRDVFRF